MRYTLASTVVGILMAVLSTASLAETTKSFQVSADIVRGCIVATNAAGDWGKIDFGTVSGVASGTVDSDLLAGAVSGIQIDCTPATTAFVTVDNGDHATSGVRRMGLGATAYTIPYELFADGSSTPWTTQSVAVSFTLGTSRRVLPVRGRATLTRPMTAGAYTDTVRVTLTW